MKKSQKLAKGLAIRILIASVLEVIIISVGVAMAIRGQYDRGCFWLLCVVVFDMQFGSYRGAVEDQIDRAEAEEAIEDLHKVAERKNWSERMDELNRKNNKQ